MTVKEKKLLAVGAGAGILASAVLVALLTSNSIQGYAAEKTPPASMATARPNAAAAQPESDQGTQPGTTLELTPAEITAAGVQVAQVQSAVLKTNIDSFGRVEQ